MIQFDAEAGLNALSHYNRADVLGLDRKAAQLFAQGLAITLEELTSQIDFVLYQYGGLSSPRSPGLLSEISRNIMENRGPWDQLIANAPSYRFGVGAEWSFSIPEAVHFDCFAPLRKAGSAAQTRCLTKLLHLVKPAAFMIQDRWIAHGLGGDVPEEGGPASYRALTESFRQFVSSHSSAIRVWQLADQPGSWSDLKLIDKILLCRRAAGRRRAA